MDPVTAFSLSCNVLQVVGTSLKVLSSAIKLYKQRGTTSSEYKELRDVCVQLHKTNEDLDIYLVNWNAGGSSDKSYDQKITEQQDRELRYLCNACNELARKLYAEIDSYKISREHPIEDIWRVLWKDRDKLLKMKEDMIMYRDQLDTRILASLRQMVDKNSREFQVEFQKLDSRTREIAEDVLEFKGFYTQTMERQTREITDHLDVRADEIVELLRALTPSPGSSPRISISGAPPPAYWQAAMGDDKEEKTSDPSLPILEAVREGDNVRLRKIIRDLPNSVYSYDRETGQTALHIACKTDNLEAVKQLIKDGAKINPDDDEGKLPLHYAAICGNGETLRFLMQKGGMIRHEDNSGMKPIDYAADDSEANWILRYGPRLEAKDDKNSTALHHFSLLGNEEAVLSLLRQGAKPDSLNANEQTPLCDAASTGQTKVIEILLDHGAEIEHRDHRKATALIIAAWHGQSKSILKLISRGADVNACNNINYTALNEAAFHSHIDVARVLLESGKLTDIDHGDYFGLSPLSRAVQEKNPEMVKLLLEHGADKECKSKEGFTPLHVAARLGRVKCVRYLMDAGANPNARAGDKHYSPLHFAAMGGHALAIERILEIPSAQDCDLVNSGNIDHWSALHEAAYYNHVDAIKTLLRNGADVDAVGDGRTPLVLCCQEANFEAAQALIEGGANVNQRDKDLNTPLMKCAELNRNRIAKALLSAGAQVNAANHLGYSPLNRASMDGHMNLVRVLLDVGNANIEHRNAGGWTSVLEACRWGHSDILKYLLDKGAEPEAMNESGYSPLNMASMWGHFNCVKLLIEKARVDINHPNMGGWTSVMEASRHGHGEILEYLLRKGARTDGKSFDGLDAGQLATKWHHQHITAILSRYEAIRAKNSSQDVA